MRAQDLIPEANNTGSRPKAAGSVIVRDPESVVEPKATGIGTHCSPQAGFESNSSTAMHSGPHNFISDHVEIHAIGIFWCRNLMD